LLYFTQHSEKNPILCGKVNALALIQNYVWISRYADSLIRAEKYGGKAMTDIKADHAELELLYTLIDRYKNRSTKMSVHESHKDIAEIFKQGRFADGSHDIINIDYHHDCFDTSDDGNIDCGNWGKLLSEQGKIDKLFWVGRNDSDDYESDIITERCCGIQELLDSPALMNGIDHIFICRSGVWSPPHLDEDFILMVLRIKNMLGRNGNIRGIYKLIQHWDSQIMENIDMLTNQIRGIHEDKLLGVT
jgi:hypothetical protein